MRVHIELENLKKLPQIHQLDLAKIMWEEGNNFSRMGNSCYINECTYLTLSWDKWLDDKRWESNSKSKEYIDFEYYEVDKELHVEIKDDSLILDKRAFHRAIVFIANSISAKVNLNEEEWIDIKEYTTRNSYFLNMTFQEALNLSLNIK